MTDERHFGWKTMKDGSRAPMSEQEVRDLWSRVEASRAARAEKLPTTVDALTAICQAESRLRELGWRQMPPQEGQTLACCFYGSTGIFLAARHGDYIHVGDYVYRPHNKTMLFKPTDRLSDEERAVLERCEAEERAAHEREMQRYARLAEMEEQSGERP